MGQNRLTFEERQAIERLNNQHINQTCIARILKRATVTIHHELHRLGETKDYTAEGAHDHYLKSIEKGYKKIGKSSFVNMSSDIKNKLIDLKSKGLPIREIAAAVGLSKSTAVKYIRLIEKEGVNPTQDSDSFCFSERISAIEMQIEIIIEKLRKLDARN